MDNYDGHVCSPWARDVRTVIFGLIAIDPPKEVMRWRLINQAAGMQKDLGILALNSDESKELVRLLHPGPETNFYQSWFAERMKNPSMYHINGKPLSNMTVSQRVDSLNVAWNNKKQVNRITNQ